ncbi:hypothetical protein [Eubacterium sp. AB3007]|uniref:hypothetical protein n=1 Tax=Eubacterium sp. AB3007 TaxID=1392487 RepID=UPI000484634B|nr:hypothetical protein [Eubacterium sp. AB3007]
MKARCTLPNRKDLVTALEKHLGVKEEYKGAPTFDYVIGPYRINREGILEAEDEEVDEGLLRELIAKGAIEDVFTDPESIEISIPIANHNGKSLMNIVFRIHSKDELLSKICGRKGAFKISQTFIAELDALRPKWTDEFMEILESCGGNEINSGIVFTKEKVIFTGFQATDKPGVVDAYMRLVELISREAVAKKRIRPERIGLPENEKYAFRNWLVTAGMNGEEYKAARAILLRNLSGNTAFRTKKQADAQKTKWEKIRRERREQECSEFHVL